MLAVLDVCANSALAQSAPMVRMTPAIRAIPAEIKAAVTAAQASDDRPDFEASTTQGESPIGDATLTPDVIAARAASGLDAAEIAEMKAVFDAFTPNQQEEMRAYYTDLGIDLDVLFGVASAKAAQAQKGQMIAQSMRELDFVRAPAAVLSARAKLGFGQVSQPDPTSATPSDVAKWIHLQVMAGEWNTFTTVCDGNTVTILVNGKEVNKATGTNLSEGFIGLQVEGGAFEVKRCTLEPL